MASQVLAGTAVGRPAKSFSGHAAALAPAPATHIGPHGSANPALDCVRSILPAHVTAAAERRSERIGVGIERVLIAGGTLSEETYLRALGGRLGIAFEALDDFQRAACPLSDERLIVAFQVGVLPIQDADDLLLVIAPRGSTVRRLAGLIEAKPAMASWFRFTTTENLKRFVLRHAADGLVARAANRLKRDWPELAAGPPRQLAILVPVAAAAFVTAAAALIAPMLTAHCVALSVALLFLSSIGLRIVGALTRVDTLHSVALSDESLPVYSIICALYREAKSVHELLCALEKLDYPGIMAQTPQAL